MEKEYYEITGDFNLNITVGMEDKSDIPNMREFERLLSEGFDEVLCDLLNKYELQYEEVHGILSDGLFRERVYESE